MPEVPHIITHMRIIGLAAAAESHQARPSRASGASPMGLNPKSLTDPVTLQRKHGSRHSSMQALIPSLFNAGTDPVTLCARQHPKQGSELPQLLEHVESARPPFSRMRPKA